MGFGSGGSLLASGGMDQDLPWVLAPPQVSEADLGGTLAPGVVCWCQDGLGPTLGLAPTQVSKADLFWD